MSTLSAFTIQFTDSSDFKRFVLGFHGLVVFALWTSCIPWLLSLPLSVFLLLNMLYLWSLGQPSRLSSLVYQHQRWYLIFSPNDILDYDKVTIAFDGGAFLLLALFSNQKKRLLVVFKDQMDEKSLRLFCLFNTINSSATRH